MNEDEKEIKPLIDMEGLAVLTSALNLINEITLDFEDENIYEQEILVNAGVLFDIVELLMLFSEQYEGDILEKMRNIDEQDILKYIDFGDSKPN